MYGSIERLLRNGGQPSRCPASIASCSAVEPVLVEAWAFGSACAVECGGERSHGARTTLNRNSDRDARPRVTSMNNRNFLFIIFSLALEMSCESTPRYTSLSLRTLALLRTQLYKAERGTKPRPRTTARRAKLLGGGDQHMRKVWGRARQGRRSGPFLPTNRTRPAQTRGRRRHHRR